jgi:hypothetical protein
MISETMERSTPTPKGQYVAETQALTEVGLEREETYE